MKYTKGLVKRKLKSLEGVEWYHQRFDGCPLLIQGISEAEIKVEPRKPKPTVGTVRCAFFHNDRCDWYIIMDDNVNTTEHFVKKCRTELHYSRRLMEKWVFDQKKFYAVCREVGKTNLSSLSDTGLIEIFKRFWDIYTKKVSSSSLIDGFALGSDQLVAEMILELLEKRGLAHKNSEIFSQLTAPIHQSFINIAEVSLLNVAHEVTKHPKLKNVVIKKKYPEVRKEILKHPKVKQLLEKHKKDYFWSKNNYVSNHVLDEKHFISEIKEWLSHSVVPKKEIKKILDTPNKNKKKKQALFKKLKVGKQLKGLIYVSEDFTHWQDERKKSTFWTTHYLSLIMKEIAKRTGYTLHESKYISPTEVKNIFKKRISKETVKKRMGFCGILWTQNGHEIITGKEALKLKDVIVGKTDFSKIREVRGLCASLGYAKGTVRLIKSATEVSKMKKGDILVAIMTRPDYIIGIKKAAAIVTNEGGVTSHAAIVSRELGIPCVIGTKNGTDVFKDGDTIEVLADEGLVRKINK